MLEKKTVTGCCDHDYCAGWNDAVDAMPRWISVEERLPERHGQQCVGLYSIGGYKGHLTPYVFTWHAYGDNGYINGPHFNNEGLDGLKVHYWMPLPELPEMKED